MSDSEAEPDYPLLPANLFDTPIIYLNPEVPEQLPSITPLYQYPTTAVKMADESFSSGKKPMFSFSARIDKKTMVNVKFDNIGKLTAQENYWIWSTSMMIILTGIKAYEIVVDGVTPAEDADTSDLDAYDHHRHTTSNIFIQIASQDTMAKIVELEKPHLMWTWLRTEYYRDSAYALVSQLMNLVSLPTQYSGSSLSDFISKFESQWHHVTKLSNGSPDLY